MVKESWRTPLVRCCGGCRNPNLGSRTPKPENPNIKHQTPNTKHQTLHPYHGALTASLSCVGGCMLAALAFMSQGLGCRGCLGFAVWCGGFMPSNFGLWLGVQGAGSSSIDERLACLAKQGGGAGERGRGEAREGGERPQVTSPSSEREREKETHSAGGAKLAPVPPVAYKHDLSSPPSP